MSDKKYQPKGSMCANCKNRFEDCSGLDFKSMPVIAEYKGSAVVICRDFEKVKG